MNLFVLFCSILASAIALPMEAERIVGGEIVEPNSIPFIVSLQIEGVNVHFCGGSILNKNAVLTASHCCDPWALGETVRVVAGEHDTLSNDGTEQIRHVTEVIVHEEHNTDTLQNDLCIVKFDDLEFNEFVQPVKLPSPGQEFPVGSETISTGWGITGTGTVFSRYLRSIKLALGDDNLCDQYYSIYDIDTMVCAGGQVDHGVCSGDSGSPLLCNANGIAKDGIHCGITSFGAGCGSQFPSGYMQTSAYIDWIESHM